MTRKAFMAPGASTAGPYSHAVETDGLVFLSGQTPVDPATGKLVEGSIGDRTRQCFVNLGAVLKAAGLTFADVVKCNVFLTDMSNFDGMNEVYAQFFEKPYPARSTIGVASLPRGASVEIELIARRSGS